MHAGMRVRCGVWRRDFGIHVLKSTRRRASIWLQRSDAQVTLNGSSGVPSLSATRWTRSGPDDQAANRPKPVARFSWRTRGAPSRRDDQAPYWLPTGVVKRCTSPPPSAHAHAHTHAHAGLPRNSIEFAKANWYSKAESATSCSVCKRARVHALRRACPLAPGQQADTCTP